MCEIQRECNVAVIFVCSLYRLPNKRFAIKTWSALQLCTFDVHSIEGELIVFAFVVSFWNNPKHVETTVKYFLLLHNVCVNQHEPKWNWKQLKSNKVINMEMQIRVLQYRTYVTLILIHKFNRVP